MQLFNYYNQLQTRKLQYTGALFTAAGVFFALWKDVSRSEFAEPFCLAATFTFMVLLQMFSRIRRHVHRVAVQVNQLAGSEVLELPQDYSAGLQGITFYLYILTIIFAIIWLSIFWNRNVIAARALVLIFVAQLLQLNLLHGPEGDITLGSLLKWRWNDLKKLLPVVVIAAPPRRLYREPRRLSSIKIQSQIAS